MRKCIYVHNKHDYKFPLRTALSNARRHVELDRLFHRDNATSSFYSKVLEELQNLLSVAEANGLDLIESDFDYPAWYMSSYASESVIKTPYGVLVYEYGRIVKDVDRRNQILSEFNILEDVNG